MKKPFPIINANPLIRGLTGEEGMLYPYISLYTLYYLILMQHDAFNTYNHIHNNILQTEKNLL